MREGRSAGSDLRALLRTRLDFRTGDGRAIARRHSDTLRRSGRGSHAPLERGLRRRRLARRGRAGADVRLRD